MSSRGGDWVTVKVAMKQTLGDVALVVRDYDEALDFFTRTLHFSVVEDTRLSDDKRWVLIAPPGSGDTSLLLARAATPEQVRHIGNQTGGRVFLFLYTDDFWRDYREMTERKVKFTREPRQEPYGTVAVFEDLYGNRWDLLEPK
jgi:catechol 2,3-dioxygenase-like lactoylglutathione lyase family enzyme